MVVAGCLLLVWRLVGFMCCFGMVVFLVLGAWLLDSFGWWAVVILCFVLRCGLGCYYCFGYYCVSLLVRRFGS